MSEIPSAEALVDTYGESYFSGGMYFSYTDDRNAIERNAHARLRQIEGLIGVGRLLDVGCAAGFFLAVARGRGWDTIGVDLSRYACEHAREHLGLKVVTGTVADLEEERGTFDAVTLWDTIEHVPDPKAVIDTAASFLRSGGVLALSTGDIRSIMSRIFGRHWRLMTYDHLYYFSQRTIRQYLESAGLSIIKVAKPGRWINAKLIAHRLMLDFEVAKHMPTAMRNMLLRLTSPLPPIYLNFWDVMTVHAQKQ